MEGRGGVRSANGGECKLETLGQKAGGGGGGGAGEGGGRGGGEGGRGVAWEDRGVYKRW